MKSIIASLALFLCVVVCAEQPLYDMQDILDALDNGPNRDNTVVCVWADHGFYDTPAGKVAQRARGPRKKGTADP